MYNQGDLIVVPFPFSDLTNSKLRPALVVSVEGKLRGTNDVIIVMITTKPKDTGINIELSLNDISIALPAKSYVRCHRIVTIDNKIVLKRIGKASDEIMKKILPSIVSLISQ